MCPAELICEGDPRKRRALIERIQAVFYEDVGRIKIGDLFTLYAIRDLVPERPVPALLERVARALSDGAAPGAQAAAGALCRRPSFMITSSAS